MRQARSMCAMLVAVSLLTSCGGDEGPVWSDEVPESLAIEAAGDAAWFVNNIVTAITDGEYDSGILLAPGASGSDYTAAWVAKLQRDGYRRGPNAAVRALVPVPLAGAMVDCATRTGVDSLGIPIDTDEDGIPDDYTTTWGEACTFDGGTYLQTTRGSFRVRDIGSVYGFRVDVVNFESRTDYDNGDFYEFTQSGTETADYQTSGITHSVTMRYGNAQEVTPPEAGAAVEGPAVVSSAGVASSTAWSYTQESHYAPESPLAVGDPIPSGDLDLTFTYRILYANSGESWNANWKFSITTPTLLHWNTACSAGDGAIDAGVLEGLLNGSADKGFTVTWSDCDTYDVVTFGTTIGDATAATP